MPSTLKSSLKVSLLSLILLLSLTEVSYAHPTPAYSHDGGRQTCQPCWMKYLKDDVLLSQLSIPGTHETMSFYGGDIGQCQSMSLATQLQSGIRVLDVRCRHMRNRFRIYHGIADQHAWFYEVLNTVVDFLEKHPSETVLMRVKEENNSSGSNRPFQDTFRIEYWGKYMKYMWLGKSKNPTLGDMRGKIVILQDFDRENPTYGILHNSFKIQDYYDLGSNFDLYDKWLEVKAHLDRANKDWDKPGNRETTYMNYLSASGGSFPYFVVSGHWEPTTGADRLSTLIPAPGNGRVWPNFPRLSGYIYFEGTNILTYGAMRPGGEYQNRVGIIMTDFPGWGLINRVIDLNKPFWKYPNRPNECSENVPGKCGQPSCRSK